jgi:NAD(P)-dependent dehydrogenase (short-subunit alcohol dehydrogenase family)
MNEFSNRNILIVGGSSGIGLELAGKLNAAGAHLAIWSRNPPEQLGPGTWTHSAVDVTKPIARQEPSWPDPLQGLVYCPGSITLGAFSRMKEEQFLADFDLNLIGAVRVLQHCLRSFDREGASVVLFSTVAVSTGLPLHASIAAAKGGVEALVRCLAAEYARKNIRFNALAPTLTDTPLASELLSTDEKRSRARQRNPLGRVGTPTDLAGAAEFLLSNNADWITGQVLPVDGGFSSLRVL